MSLTPGISYSLNINSLLADISSSVSRIKGGADEHVPVAQNGGFFPVSETSAYALSFGGVLSGRSLFSVQEYISENPQKDTGAERYKRNIYNQDTKTVPETSEPLSTYSFKDFVRAENKSIFYQKASAAYQGMPLVSAVENNAYAATGTRNYAVHSYNYVNDINKQPQVLIDFMHEYNRNFNFEI